MDAAAALAHIVQLAGLIAILLGAGFCLAARDKPLFLAAIFYVIAIAASLAVQKRHGGMQYAVMAVDAIYLIILVAIAMQWRRQWTLWAAAFQALSVLTHAAFLLKSVHRVEYLTLLALWSYLVMVAMCVGAGMAWQRRWAHRRQGYLSGRGSRVPRRDAAGGPVHDDISTEKEGAADTARSL